MTGPSLPFRKVFRNKTVLVTGNTGFKGSWLCSWLLQLGAKPVGLALAPSTNPSLFSKLGLAERMDTHEIDVRNFPRVRDLIARIKPDFLFHLAAQALVMNSFREPLEFFSTNVMGTANVLEAIKAVGRPCVAVIITSDKCYENQEWDHGYRESDPMGGADPYSASKGCAELVVAAYRRSFFHDSVKSPLVASARAGNVIGGGDWSSYRIVPDIVASYGNGNTLHLRNPFSTRPWQHVLDCLSGYMTLAFSIWDAFHRNHRNGLVELLGPFNFGPNRFSNRTVLELVEEFAKHWPLKYKAKAALNAPIESGLLCLSTDKTFHRLGWQPALDFAESVALTAHWYQKEGNGGSVAEMWKLTGNQIAWFCKRAAERKIPWAVDCNGNGHAKH